MQPAVSHSRFGNNLMPLMSIFDERQAEDDLLVWYGNVEEGEITDRRSISDGTDKV